MKTKQDLKRDLNKTNALVQNFVDHGGNTINEREIPSKPIHPLDEDESFSMSISPKKPKDDKITVPFKIDNDEFILELEDIRSIEIIDLNAPDPVTPANILDQINQAPTVT